MLKKNQKMGRLWFMKAEILMGLQQLKDAVKCLDKARKLAGENPKTWNLLGDAYKRMGASKEAEKAFTKARQLGQ